MSNMVYKVCPAAAWVEAVACGRYTGSLDDQRDGFIHLSTADQLLGTLAKHFAGQNDLVLVYFRTADLGADLRFEASRHGELFPHVYGLLPTEKAVAVRPLPLGPTGVHLVPEDLA